MIAIINYGAGNLGSVYKAFRYLGADVEVTNDRSAVERADALVLPGVGAFGHCMAGLDRVRLTEATRTFIRTGRPFLGICVGMQMLFQASEENACTPGLGILPGTVVRFDLDGKQIPDAARLKVPHIGWNELEFQPGSVLFQGLNQRDRVYFVHSYYPEPRDDSVVSARTDYGGSFCSAVESGNIHATQFHPEKSGAVGLQILRNFVTLST